MSRSFGSEVFVHSSKPGNLRLTRRRDPLLVDRIFHNQIIQIEKDIIAFIRGHAIDNSLNPNNIENLRICSE
jgi:hypothetical protein